MSDSGDGPRPTWANPLTFHLVEVPASRGSLCRCGLHLPAGRTVLEIVPTSDRLREVFATRSFCSLVCLRAFVREAIEAFDGSSERHSQEVCSDLRELVVDLQEVWAELEKAHLSK